MLSIHNYGPWSQNGSGGQHNRTVETAPRIGFNLSVPNAACYMNRFQQPMSAGGKERLGVTKDGNSRAAARLNTVDETRTSEHSFDALPQFPCIHRFHQRPNLTSVIRTLLLVFLFTESFVGGFHTHTHTHTHTENISSLSARNTQRGRQTDTLSIQTGSETDYSNEVILKT